jgi:hypothetical protein
VDVKSILTTALIAAVTVAVVMRIQPARDLIAPNSGKA